MGEVYEAEDTRKHRVVALKLISAQYSDDSVFRARMRREADTAGRLNEPHIVPIHDYGEIDGQFYVEMRLIDGASLRTVLTHYGPLTPARTVAIVRHVAAALDAAHANGVTHRDVKPENILIGHEDFAYLVDFGIARAATDPGLTQHGTAVGTYNYMAPERFTGDEVTYRADIYALACVLGECLTGAPPYRADSLERLIAAHLLEPAPRPSQLRPGRVPQALDPVIARGMAKNPGDRFVSAGDLAIAAHQALTGPEQMQESAILHNGAYSTMLAAAANARAGQTWSGETMVGRLPSNSGVNSFPPAVEHASWPGQPSMQMSTSGPERKAPRRFRRLWPIVGAAAILLAVLGVAAGYVLPRASSSAKQPTGQTVLPFNGLNFRLSPGGVAVDGSGTVYVTNQGMYGRVVSLASGSSTPTVQPFAGLYEPQGVAVDSAGTMYVSDFNNRVVALAAGSNNQRVLPFDGLNYPEGVAVDTQGNVYVADRGNNRVVKLAAGSNAQTVLPFNGLNNPDGVAVDNAGNVYVTDTDNNRVIRLDAGSSNQTVLPFPGLSAPWGIAVDNAGDVYVTEHDNDQVVKWAAGAITSTVLPFTGLNTPLSVATDKKGNVYVGDRGDDRVVRLTS
jgi:serine/threonine protein kinase, bacterial